MSWRSWPVDVFFSLYARVPIRAGLNETPLGSRSCTFLSFFFSSFCFFIFTVQSHIINLWWSHLNSLSCFVCCLSLMEKVYQMFVVITDAYGMGWDGMGGDTMLGYLCLLYLRFISYGGVRGIVVIDNMLHTEFSECCFIKARTWCVLFRNRFGRKGAANTASTLHKLSSKKM